MKKLLWIPAALVCGLVLSCNWENAASDVALTPENTSPLVKMGYAVWPDEDSGFKLSDLGVIATVCCGRSTATSGDGSADNAIDGNTGAWWHPDWSGANASGHKGDTTAWSGEGGYRPICV